MKKVLCMLLAMAMVLSLAACGAETEPETTAPEIATAAPTTEPITEPTTEATLSPEELLYNSLTDRQKLAVDLGIVELSQMEDMERTVTLAEVAGMLQKAYVHRIGVESRTFRDLQTDPTYGPLTATRGLVAPLPGYGDTEILYGDAYESYDQWRKEALEIGDDLLWWELYNRMGLRDSDVHWGLPEKGDREKNAADLDVLREMDTYWVNEDMYVYALWVYDGTNGKKFMYLEDGLYFNPQREMTLAEVVESALVYYNYPDPIAIPQFVAPEEVGPCNADIITADLLEKETSLPMATCQQLPSQWHGVVFNDWNWLDWRFGTDLEIYEYEVQAVKDAGFNFIGLNLDISWLQDYWVQRDTGPFLEMMDPEDAGSFSLERLEKLDRLLAWCMERDIHLNIRVTLPGNVDHELSAMQALSSGTFSGNLVRYWQALARRYREIPNNYLSFTLLSNKYSGVNNSALLPSVDAIREESPDRCIIADAYGYLERYDVYSVKAFAERGVALSYTLQATDTTILDHADLYTHDRTQMANVLTNEKPITEFTWPYQGKDGQWLLTHDRYGAPSFLETAEIAEEYGVGFMLSNFGVNLPQNDAVFPDFRYPDDAYKAMLSDILSCVESRGYGWCFTGWYGYFGIADCVPRITGSTYTQVEDYPYYLDETMLGWFREFNQR